jgi:hypothetical protein
VAPGRCLLHQVGSLLQIFMFTLTIVLHCFWDICHWTDFEFYFFYSGLGPLLDVLSPSFCATRLPHCTLMSCCPYSSAATSSVFVIIFLRVIILVIVLVTVIVHPQFMQNFYISILCVWIFYFFLFFFYVQCPSDKLRPHVYLG